MIKKITLAVFLLNQLVIFIVNNGNMRTDESRRQRQNANSKNEFLSKNVYHILKT